MRMKKVNEKKALTMMKLTKNKSTKRRKLMATKSAGQKNKIQKSSIHNLIMTSQRRKKIKDYSQVCPSTVSRKKKRSNNKSRPSSRKQRPKAGIKRSKVSRGCQLKFKRAL